MQEKKIWNTNYKDFVPEGNIKDTILILHWWWWSSESWLQIWEILENNWFRVIVPDLPWFWETPLTSVFTLDLYKDFVVEFAKSLWLNDFILWGHSNWWAISIKVANSKELNIKLLVLNNSAGIRDDEKRVRRRSFIWNISKPFKFITNTEYWKKARRLFYKAIWSHDYIKSEEVPFMKETYLIMISSDLQKEIRNIETPTLLIWWEKDTYTPLADWEYMKRNIKNSSFIVLENEKHWIHLQNPQLLAKTFLNYIKNNIL